MSYTPTVLLVDDSPINLEMLGAMLEKSGIAVVKVHSGSKALEYAAESVPDLIVMDVMMPDLSGFETCRRLKEQETIRDVPVIFITALVDEASTLEGFEAGGVDYITKPFNQRETLARVRTHLALRQLRKELESKNQELLGEIARREDAEEEQRQLERQLRQSQRLEAIGTLAGGIAHDFNNILGTIQGYTEYLIGKQPEASAETLYLERIFRAAERAAALVKRLLTFSRSHEQHLAPIELRPVIVEALDMLRATIPATIAVRRHLSAECPRVRADASQIHQLVVNLCINASQAMPEGGVLDVRLEAVGASAIPDIMRPDSPHDQYAQLSVRDTGRGMTADVQERIFDPFFTTRATEGGTGLGLSVVHGIVQGHQGLLHVDSQPGSGTRFSVFLPAYDGDMPENRPSPASARPEPASTPTGAKKRILVVDDETDLANLLRMALQDAHYAVDVRYNGADALDTVRARPDAVDLVITDQAMPGLDGAALSRELLALKPDLPIILTTGYSSRMSHDAAADIGIRHFLTKPVKIPKLLQIVRDILE